MVKPEMQSMMIRMTTMLKSSRLSQEKNLSVEVGDGDGVVFLADRDLILLLAEVAHDGHHPGGVGEVAQANFDDRGFVVLPTIELAHGRKWRDGIGFVENRHVRTIDAADFEAAHADALFKEVGEDAIADLEIQVVGLFSRNQEFVGIFGTEIR